MTTITTYRQSSVTIRSGGRLLAIDIGSYADEAALITIGSPDYALVSHIHKDHFLEANLARMAAPVHTVGEVARQIADASLAVSAHRVGETAELGPFSVGFLPSDHGPNVSAPVEQAAFLIRAEGRTIYFMADMYVGAPRPEGPLDLVLIPVGNKGYTFSPAMAVDHLKDIGWTGLTVPIHYDVNPPALEEFMRLADGVCDARVPGLGGSLEL